MRTEIYTVALEEDVDEAQLNAIASYPPGIAFEFFKTQAELANLLNLPNSPDKFELLFIKLRVIKCIVNIRIVNAFIHSSLYSCETYRQVKEMVILHLFIEHHYKSIVSIIRERHVLTLHLSTAN